MSRSVPVVDVESAARLGKELRVGGEFVDSDFLLQFAGGMLPIRDALPLLSLAVAEAVLVMLPAAVARTVTVTVAVAPVPVA